MLGIHYCVLGGCGDGGCWDYEDVKKMTLLSSRTGDPNKNLTILFVRCKLRENFPIKQAMCCRTYLGLMEHLYAINCSVYE